MSTELIIIETGTLHVINKRKESVIIHPRALFPGLGRMCFIDCFLMVCMAQGLPGFCKSPSLLEERGKVLGSGISLSPPVCAWWPDRRGHVWGGGNYRDGPTLMSVISLHSRCL